MFYSESTYWQKINNELRQKWTKTTKANQNDVKLNSKWNQSRYILYRTFSKSVFRKENAQR